MSNIRIDNIAPSAGGTYRNAPRGIAAAWCTWDASTATVNDSVNLSSLTDNASGDFTTNYTNNFSAIKTYTHGGLSAHIATDIDNQRLVSARNISDLLVGSTRLYMRYANPSGAGIYDYGYVQNICHGDLA